MASSASSTSDVPGIEKEYDLLKLSEFAEGKKEAEAPLGFKFLPTDGEIVVCFLFNKILDRLLPITDVIKEINVYVHDPAQLPNGDFKHGKKFNEAFYFSYIDQSYSEGKVTRRPTNGGYWKVIGEEEEVKYKKGHITFGFKNLMEFYKGQAPKGKKTSFVMSEYRLNPREVPAHVLNDNIRTKIERYVVCRIVNKGISNEDSFE